MKIKIKDKMLFTNFNRIFSILLGIILFSSSSFALKNYKISYLYSIDNEYIKNKNKGLISNLTEFLIGAENIELQNPKNLIKIDTNTFIILDNGLQSILYFNNEELKLINEDKGIYFPSLIGICKAFDDKIFFSDSKLNKIFFINNDKSIDEFTTEIKLNQPTSIVYTKLLDQLILSETGNHRIIFFNKSGKVEKIIGKRGNQNVEFNYPTYLWINNNNELIVNDAMNYRIQILDLDGKFRNSFGEQGDASGYFSSIKGVATDSFGHIYVVDALFNTVQIFDISGNFLDSFGKKGNGTKEFLLPTGIFIDSENKIYLADTYNSRIQVFQIEEEIR